MLKARAAISFEGNEWTDLNLPQMECPEASMENASQIQVVEHRDVWKRGLFMLFFAIAFSIAQMVLSAMTMVQFVWLLATRQRNENLARFGESLSTWLAGVARFQSCTSDDKPFPWRPWP
jgi:hypothetical protein